MNEFKLQRYRDLGDILTDSFTYIRIHFKSLGKALTLLVLPFYIFSGMLVGNAYGSFMSAVMDNPDITSAELPEMQFFLGIMLLFLTTGALLTIVLTHIRLSQDHDQIEINMILDQFGQNFIKLVLLYTMVIFITVFGFFLFIIPGIYVGIKLFISPAVAILEDRNPFDAISRSWDLVQGHWWFTFAVYLVMNIITSFMSYVLIIPFSIVIGFLTASGADSSGVMGTSIGIFYGLLIIFASLFSVIMLIAMSLQYFNLIERKEGRGLRAQIEELG